MALATGEQLVSVTNHARSMTSPEVHAPYNTTLGRGHRHARLRAEWLCSTFLATVLNDPKNAAWRVPACGDLRVWNPRLVKKRQQVDGNALDSFASSLETTFETSAPSIEPWLGDTVFEVLVKLVSVVAVDWSGPMHQDLREGFSLTISLGKSMWAEMKLFYERHEDGSVSWLRVPFHAANSEIEISAVTPVLRQAVIQVQHIQMLASLYAGTLKHEGVLPLSTPFETAPVLANTGAETENAGSLPGESAPSKTLPHDNTRLDTDVPRKISLHTADSTVSVCLPSRGIEPLARRRIHDPHFASHQHGLSLA